MIDFRHRFHGHGSLRYVHKNGDSVRSRYFVVKSLQNRHRSHSRFAVVISKKTLKRAVGRNRVRRRVYEVIRHELERINSHRDIVVIVVSAEVRDLSPVELYRAVQDVFVRAGVYKSTSSSGIIFPVSSTDIVEKSD